VYHRHPKQLIHWTSSGKCGEGRPEILWLQGIYKMMEIRNLEKMDWNE
jgi:hypothetical protein